MTPYPVPTSRSNRTAAALFVEGQKKLLAAANETLEAASKLRDAMKTLSIKANSAEQYGLPGKAIAKKLGALEKAVADVYGGLDAIVGQVEDAE